MKKFVSVAIMAILSLAAGLMLSGCLVSMDKALIAPSKSGNNVPDISGAYVGPDKNNYVISRAGGFLNTFKATPPDKKNTVTITLEPLKTAGRFIFQLQHENDPKVLLGICTIKDQTMEVYDFKAGELLKLAKKHGVTIDPDTGLIKSQKSLAKTKEFFEASFDSKYSALALPPIKPGSSKQPGNVKKPLKPKK